MASGLDSQVPGETEILGQVKQAYQYAVDMKDTGRLLNLVFQKSFQTAKWIRTNTNIGRGHVSVGNIAVDLATRIVGDLGKARILMVGTGDVGQQTLKAIRSRGGETISIASRTLARLQPMAVFPRDTLIGVSECSTNSFPKVIRMDCKKYMKWSSTTILAMPIY